MAILKVARLGHPVLRQPAQAIDLAHTGREDFQRFIDDMVETMLEYDGVGLAAPQVHVSKTVVVFEVGKNPRYPNAPAIPRTVLVNPEFQPLGAEEVDDWEGCLSIPDLRGRVSRAKQIRVRGWDRYGQRIEFEAEGFHARVIQHECDHINGRVFLDRMRSLESLTHLSEFYRYWSDDRSTKSTR